MTFNMNLSVRNICGIFPKALKTSPSNYQKKKNVTKH